MNKEDYLVKLATYIRKLPKEEQAEILGDYEEHFENAGRKGLAEHDIIRKLGSPRVIGKEILLQQEITRAEKTPSLNNLTKAVLAVLGVGMINLLFVFLPFIMGLMVLAALFLISVYIVLSPVILLIQDGFTLTFALEFPSAVGLVGVGLLLFQGTSKLMALGYGWMIAYLNMNRKWIKGRVK